MLLESSSTFLALLIIKKILSLLSLFLGMISHHKCSAFFIVIPTKELLDVLLLENICVN